MTTDTDDLAGLLEAAGMLADECERQASYMRSTHQLASAHWISRSADAIRDLAREVLSLRADNARLRAVEAAAPFMVAREQAIADGQRCGECGGSGYKTYGSTATWRGGIGGAALTDDLCDGCWGSGDASRPWRSHRELDEPLERAGLEGCAIGFHLASVAAWRHAQRHDREGKGDVAEAMRALQGELKAGHDKRRAALAAREAGPEGAG